MRQLFALIMLCLGLPLAAQDLLERRGDHVPPEVERMYTRGLTYLATSQQANGTWPDNYGKQPGVVGLAVLAMLAHGEDPNYGPYSQAIERGLAFILKAQNKENGYIGNSMYNHGFATLALAEAYGAVNDERLGPALAEAVDLLLSAQQRNPTGAWRYHPESTDADTTASGACLMALYAARNAGLGIPEEALRKALQFYELCQTPEGGFGYTHAIKPNAARGAIGTLVIGLEDRQRTRVYRRAYDYLKLTGYAPPQTHWYYYLYYASQAFFHGPEEEQWDAWNQQNIETLQTMQNDDGSWQANNGPTFTTSAALLSLALNYRFLPIYER